MDITTDAGGNFEHGFTVPEDYGWYHDVAVVQPGVIRNKAPFSIDMEVTISPKRGPVGTPITIDVRSMGWSKQESLWFVSYDNKATGYLSATTTNGRARAVITATGPPGKHLIEILTGQFTFAYRNGLESPFSYKYKTPYAFEFEVTEGEPVLPLPLAKQSLPVTAGTAPAGTGPAMGVNPAAGPVGTPIQLAARNLPPNQTVELVWTRVVGNRVSGSGWRETNEVLTKVKTDSQGNFTYDFAAPDDLGGPHKLHAMVDGKVVATASFRIQPSAVTIQPASGPVGTDFVVQLKGVGWTETANIYTIVYDNNYVGYACGFTSQGTITVNLRATGEPGWHFIDLYPGIYKGKEPMGLDTFRIPQLTYAKDHPGEQLPAFRFAFQVTP